MAHKSTTHVYECPGINTIVLVSSIYSECNGEFYYSTETKPIDSTKPYETNVEKALNHLQLCF